MYREIEDEELLGAVLAGGKDLQRVCAMLMNLANARGGRDDGAILALRCSAGEEREGVKVL